jgi:hypothetical protein
MRLRILMIATVALAGCGTGPEPTSPDVRPPGLANLNEPFTSVNFVTERNQFFAWVDLKPDHDPGTVCSSIITYWKNRPEYLDDEGPEIAHSVVDLPAREAWALVVSTITGRELVLTNSTPRAERRARVRAFFASFQS